MDASQDIPPTRKPVLSREQRAVLDEVGLKAANAAYGEAFSSNLVALAACEKKIDTQSRRNAWRTAIPGVLLGLIAAVAISVAAPAAFAALGGATFVGLGATTGAVGGFLFGKTFRRVDRELVAERNNLNNKLTHDATSEETKGKVWAKFQSAIEKELRNNVDRDRVNGLLADYYGGPYRLEYLPVAYTKGKFTAEHRLNTEQPMQKSLEDIQLHIRCKEHLKEEPTSAKERVTASRAAKTRQAI